MNMKTFAVMAASGLMAASLAYVVPAFADDLADDIDGAAPMQLAMADDTGSSDSSTSDSSSGATDNSSNSSSSSSSDSSSSSANTSGATSDQPAQGDDDY
ncbi:MAG TPA: hypothetical protein VL360_02535 [Gammaproteobacteria bacterium]|jgi:hypothetical protein|nr:hypothetical protein [Gammaproteobacteria bacterium]